MRRFDDLGGETLNPAVQRDVIYLDPPLGQQLLEIPIRQPEPEIPPHRQQDHLRRKPETRERRRNGYRVQRTATVLHPSSLVRRPPDRSTQQTLVNNGTQPGQVLVDWSAADASSASRTSVMTSCRSSRVPRSTRPSTFGTSASAALVWARNAADIGKSDGRFSP